MNRQLRRAQAKLDEKAEKEKDKKRQARRQRIDSIRAKRRTKPGSKPTGKSAGEAAPDLKKVNVKSLTKEQQRKLPGRFSGALMIATVFFIVLQAAVPPEESTVATSLTGAGFFLLFGYFSVLFQLRQGRDNALTMTLITGLALCLGVLATRFFGPNAGLDVNFGILLAAGAVGVVGGAYLGRLVFYAAPAQRR
ncbi:MAG: hypothetical protein WC972_05300 [Trueperaceae bacterium]|nr:hypothetical protein [Trueperaceae bacterium]HRQ11028.1 hypothetical protein [Trueperaceae bacterium]